MSHRRRPRLNALMSFVLPGLGQVAAGHQGRGVLVFGAYLGLVVALGAGQVALSGAAWWITAGILDVALRIAAAVDAHRMEAKAPLGCLMTAVILVAMIFAGAAVNSQVRIHLAETFTVPSAAMEPTLLPGDEVVVDKRAFEPKAGDILVFEFPENRQQDFMKRIVGMPGDVVEVKAGRLHINGTPVQSCPFEAGQRIETLGGHRHVIRHDGKPEPNQGPWTVPAGAYFVMGDHRAESHDSRFWHGGLGGTVPHDHIKGRVVRVLWPVGRLDVTFDSSSAACR